MKLTLSYSRRKISSLTGRKSYVVVCDGHLIGIFKTHDEAIRSSRRKWRYSIGCEVAV